MQTFSKVKWLTQLVQVPRCCSWRSGGRNQVCRSSLGCSHRPTECQTQRGTHSGTEQSTEHSTEVTDKVTWQQAAAPCGPQLVTHMMWKVSQNVLPCPVHRTCSGQTQQSSRHDRSDTGQWPCRPARPRCSPHCRYTGAGLVRCGHRRPERDTPAADTDLWLRKTKWQSEKDKAGAHRDSKTVTFTLTTGGREN